MGKQGGLANSAAGVGATGDEASIMTVTPALHGREETKSDDLPDEGILSGGSEPASAFGTSWYGGGSSVDRIAKGNKRSSGVDGSFERPHDARAATAVRGADDGDGGGEGDDDTTNFDAASAGWSDTVSNFSGSSRRTATCGDDSIGRAVGHGRVGENRCNGQSDGGDNTPTLSTAAVRTAATAVVEATATAATRDSHLRGEIPSHFRRGFDRCRLAGDGGEEGNDDDAYEDDEEEGSEAASASSDDGSNTAGSDVYDHDYDGGGDESDDAADVDEDPFDPIPGEVKLVASMFPDRPPTVFFEYPKELTMARFDNSYYTEPLGGRRLLFKTHWERNSVKNAFFRAGFSRTRSTLTWTASWGKHPTREAFRNLNRFQKVNHFPGSWCIGRKDRLLRTLARHRRELTSAASSAAAAAAAVGRGAASGSTASSGQLGGGTESLLPNPIDFSPEGFVLPADRRAWLKVVETEPRAIWIIKPPASSCGRGIRVINRSTAASVSKTKKILVQRYIQNPMLIDGRKFDLRLYVLVTSMEPLRVYLFEEGLVRLSTKRYTLKNLRSRFTHLTNYSINKKSGSFQAPEDSDGQETPESTMASKWALTFFWKYLEETLGKQKSDQVQRSIEDVVLRTMAAADADMTTHSHQVTRHRGCCYELFGFDVLLDEHLKPWLLEVNISPSLFGSSALDRRIKGTLMADIFHLVGFRPFDRMALRREERREARHIPGTRRSVRAVGGRPQDAWRRCQTPASIRLAELGEDEWEVIRDTEDEKHRSGHFRILYPTTENVTRLWPLFRNPRFLNGVLARWVLTGGLSNLANRADIGLTVERLATLRRGPVHAPRRGGMGNQNSVSNNDGKGLRVKDGAGTGGGRDGADAGGRSGVSSSSKGSFSPGVGSNATTIAGEARWEETTSNATTVISASGGGGAGERGRRGAQRGGGGGGVRPAPWLGADGARPASSATSRNSQASSVPRRRGSGRTVAAPPPPKRDGIKDGGGGDTSEYCGDDEALNSGQKGECKKTLGEGMANVVVRSNGAGGGNAESGGMSGGVDVDRTRKERNVDRRTVPRLQLRRVESKVVLGPALLALRAPVLSARRMGNGGSGNDGGGGCAVTAVGGLGAAGRPKRASSASSSRPSSGQSQGSAMRSRSVAVQGSPIGVRRRTLGGGGEAEGAPRTLFIVNTREVQSRRRTLHPQGESRRQDRQQLFPAAAPDISSIADVAAAPAPTERYRDKNDCCVLSHTILLGPTAAAENVPSDGTALTTAVSRASLSVKPAPALVGNGGRFPRPPGRSRHPANGSGAAAVAAGADESRSNGNGSLPAFAAALLPSSSRRIKSLGLASMTNPANASTGAGTVTATTVALSSSHSVSLSGAPSNVRFNNGADSCGNSSSGGAIEKLIPTTTQDLSHPSVMAALEDSNRGCSSKGRNTTAAASTETDKETATATFSLVVESRALKGNNNTLPCPSTASALPWRKSGLHRDNSKQESARDGGGDGGSAATSVGHLPPAVGV